MVMLVKPEIKEQKEKPRSNPKEVVENREYELDDDGYFIIESNIWLYD